MHTFHGRMQGTDATDRPMLNKAGFTDRVMTRARVRFRPRHLRRSSAPVSMSWDTAIADFRVHLKLERSLSDRTVEAYMRDLGLLKRFANEHEPPMEPNGIGLDDLQAFITWLARKKLSATSQARLLSAVRGFYRSLRRGPDHPERPHRTAGKPAHRPLPAHLPERGGDRRHRARHRHERAPRPSRPRHHRSAVRVRTCA